MALILVKKKPPVSLEEPLLAKALTPKLSPLAALIDLTGSLSEDAEKIQQQIREHQEAIKALSEKLQPLAEAQKELKDQVAELDYPDDRADIIERGEQFFITVGKKGVSRAISDIVRVHQILGDEVFYALATVPLRDIDSYLTPDQKEQVTAVTRTSRNFKLAKRV